MLSLVTMLNPLMAGVVVLHLWISSTRVYGYPYKFVWIPIQMQNSLGINFLTTVLLLLTVPEDF